MRQTITDKGHKYSILVLTGAFILLFLLFSNSQFPKITAVNSNSDEITVICDLQNDVMSTTIFVGEEDNSDKGFFNYYSGNFHFADSFLTHQYFSGDEEQKISFIKNYFHNDLSPPHFMKR